MKHRQKIEIVALKIYMFYVIFSGFVRLY